MNNLIHKPRFFIVSLIGVLLLSLGIWSLIHEGKPFIGISNSGSLQGGETRQMRRGNKQFGTGGESNFSGNNRVFSGRIGGSMREERDTMSSGYQRIQMDGEIE